MRRTRLWATLASAILATFATRAAADDLSRVQQNALVLRTFRVSFVCM